MGIPATEAFKFITYIQFFFVANKSLYSQNVFCSKFNCCTKYNAFKPMEKF